MSDFIGMTEAVTYRFILGDVGSQNPLPLTAPEEPSKLQIQFAYTQIKSNPFPFSFCIVLMRKLSRFPFHYVTFDATGTLINLRRNAGQVYLEQWEQISGQKFQKSEWPKLLHDINEKFGRAFHEMDLESPNFGKIHADQASLTGGNNTSSNPNANGHDHAKDGQTNGHTRQNDNGFTHKTNDTAYEWWESLILRVMPPNTTDTACDELRKRYTRHLYDHFSSAEEYIVYHDTFQVLDKLKHKGLKLGVISNHDERLSGVLQGLNLMEYFEVVTTSWDHGKMKPHVAIFRDTYSTLATGVHGPAPEDVQCRGLLHIGDNALKDYAGVKKAGGEGLMLIRNMQKYRQSKEVIPTIYSLDQILHYTSYS